MIKKSGRIDFNISLDQILLYRFEEYCHEAGKAEEEAMEEIVGEFLDERDSQFTFEDRGLDSGTGIMNNLEKEGLVIEGCYRPDSSDNYIRLNDRTTFNWKNNEGQIRVNCKKQAMEIIEKNTGLKHIDNGAGDPARPYSFLLNKYSEYKKVVNTLKLIEINTVSE